MKYDALLAVIVAGCANFSVFLLRPSITSELPDLALAALWFVAVFLVVYGLMRVFRRKRRTRALTEALSVAGMSENQP